MLQKLLFLVVFLSFSPKILPQILHFSKSFPQESGRKRRNNFPWTRDTAISSRSTAISCYTYNWSTAGVQLITWTLIKVVIYIYSVVQWSWSEEKIDVISHCVHVGMVAQSSLKQPNIISAHCVAARVYLRQCYSYDVYFNPSAWLATQHDSVRSMYVKQSTTFCLTLKPLL